MLSSKLSQSLKNSTYLAPAAYVINGIVNVNITTLETRYSLSTSEVAWIPATYDLTAGLSAIIFGYLGILFHNGLLLTLGVASLAVGSFVFTLPHWLGGIYEAGLADSYLCELNGKNHGGSVN